MSSEKAPGLQRWTTSPFDSKIYKLVMYIIRILNTSLIFLLEAAYYFILLHNLSFIIFGPVQKPLYWFSSTSQLSEQERLLLASVNAPGRKQAKATEDFAPLEE